MITPTDKKPQYFGILNAIQKGGLSLWLNRRTLSSMMIVPVIVTFLTLMFTRTDELREASPFMLALIQIPADFMIGVFSALIIVIIMNAPKKKKDGAPVMFALNIMEKKKVMMAGAIAHVIFSYFTAGLYGAMQLISEPMPVIIEQTQSMPMGGFFALIALLTVGFYAVRFMMLPIILIADMDVKSFFKNRASFSFSAPIFLVKFATTAALGMLAYMIASAFLMGQSPDAPLTTMQAGIIDFLTAIASVIATAWAYASLCVGVREMIEKED